MSWLSHTRSIRPSTPLTIYLGVSSLVDLARVRTLFFVHGTYVEAGVNLASFFVKLAIFSLELLDKGGILEDKWKTTSPEALAGIYSRALFSWLNPLFLKGFRQILTVESLPEPDDEILGATVPTALEARWEKGTFFPLEYLTLHGFM